MGLFKSLFGKKENKKAKYVEEIKSSTPAPKAEEMDIWKTPIEPKTKNAEPQQKVSESKKEIKKTVSAQKTSTKKAVEKQNTVEKAAPATKKESTKTEKKKDSPVESKKATTKKAVAQTAPATTNAEAAATDLDTENADKISADSTSKKVKVHGYGGAFEIKKSKDGRFVFNLFAANKVIVATSQIYSSPQSAITGINSVVANAEKAAIEDQTLKSFTPQSFPKWEIYIDKGGQFRFRLLATNGSCICHSQGYTQKSTCKKGIESIIRTVKSAKIDKAYLKKNKED